MASRVGLKGSKGRRRWSDDEKVRIVSESSLPRVRIASVARRRGTTRWRIHDWRKRLARGLLVPPTGAGTHLSFAAVVVGPENRHPAEVEPEKPAPSPLCIIDPVVDVVTIRAGADGL